jgi:ankyrin repeat protein
MSYYKKYIKYKYKYINLISDIKKQKLFLAVENNDVNNINFLLDSSININIKNNNNETPLYIAIKRKKLDSIKLLFNRGAKIY